MFDTILGKELISEQQKYKELVYKASVDKSRENFQRKIGKLITVADECRILSKFTDKFSNIIGRHYAYKVK